MSVHEEPKFYCDVGTCDRKYSQKGSLINHQRYNHSIDKHEVHENVVCEECGKRFDNANTMRVHRYNIHTSRE